MVIKIHTFEQVNSLQITENKQVSPLSTNTVFKYRDQSIITLLICENYKETPQTYASRRMVRATLVRITAEK
jgi:hypothetical protein